ncbi:MAG TPA: glycoside hydrolase family 97 N-terminal domain-containing protein, partial [Cyclobacteriaceae bacterium]|nr:glycoside hydrolase family 97 N-terminal domain-containing protein [Cyclobacteriaceae bacterium]
MNPKLLVVLLFSCFVISASAQKNYAVQSPDGRVAVTVSVGDKILYSVQHETDVVIAPSPISVKLSTGELLGVNPKLKSVKKQEINQTIQTPIYKRASITDHYNEMVLNFKEDYSIIFRAYNDGAAYRFTVTRKGNYNIEQEEATFNFNEDYGTVFPYVRSTKTTYEEHF